MATQDDGLMGGDVAALRDEIGRLQGRLRAREENARGIARIVGQLHANAAAAEGRPMPAASATSMHTSIGSGGGPAHASAPPADVSATSAASAAMPLLSGGLPDILQQMQQQMQAQMQAQMQQQLRRMLQEQLQPMEKSIAALLSEKESMQRTINDLQSQLEEQRHASSSSSISEAGLPEAEASAATTRVTVAQAVFGLPNLGNTCFTNAACQLLAGAAEVVECATSNVGAADEVVVAPEVRAIAGSVLAPTELTAAARRDAMVQLNGLMADILASERSVGASVRDAGEVVEAALKLLACQPLVLQKRLQCNACNTESTVPPEPMYIIPLSPNELHDAQLRVQDAVNTFCSAPTLLEFECEQCECESGGRMHSQVVTAPSTLAVSINRATWGKDGHAEKWRAHVLTPRTLRLQLAGGKSASYAIVGVAEHRGSRTDAGHWVAHVQRDRTVRIHGKGDAVSGMFVTFDDESEPRFTHWSQVASVEAAVLLFRRMDDVGESHEPKDGLEEASQHVGDLHTGEGDDGWQPAQHILREPIRWRAKIASSDETVRVLLHALVADDPYSLFHSTANPQLVLSRLSLHPTREHDGTLVFGQCQLGKSGVICTLAWVAHFVYDLVPIIFVKRSGGVEARHQLRNDIRNFNAHIRGLLKTRCPSVDESLYSLYYLHAVPDSGVERVSATEFLRGKAQVVLQLSTAAGVRRLTEDTARIRALLPAIKEMYEDPCHYPRRAGHRHRVCLLFDEADTLVQSPRLDYRVAEKLLFQRDASSVAPDDDGDDSEGDSEVLDAAIDSYTSCVLVNSVEHVVYITGTPAALLLTDARRHYDVAVMPIRNGPPAPYFGFSPRAEHRIQLQQVAAGTVGAPASVDLRYLGLLTMVEDMGRDATRQRVAAVHGETLIARHDDIRDWLVTTPGIAQMPLIVVTHNGGRVGTLHGCTLRTSADLHPDLLRAFEAGGAVYTTLLDRGATHLEGKAPAVNVDSRTVEFPKRSFKLMDVLDAVGGASSPSSQLEPQQPQRI